MPWSRRTAPPAPPASVVAPDWIDADAWLEWEAPRNYIAGEASHVTALERLTGPVCAAGYCRAVVVTFEREPRNRYDANATRALVERRHIGYLRRHLAAQIAPALDGARCRSFTAPGLLRGGSTGAPHVGCHVWLGRCSSPSGLVIELPVTDAEWSVPWPVHDRERP